MLGLKNIKYTKMNLSCSVSFSGLSDSKISLIYQDAMEEWLMEQQYQEEKMKIKTEKKRKRIERETKNQYENQRLVEQYFNDEKERNLRSKIRDKKLKY